FLNSLTEGWGNHVTQGIVEYTESRYNSLQDNLDNVVPLVALNQIRDNSPELDALTFKVKAEGEITWVDLTYRINSGNWQTVSLWDNGTNGDQVAEDGTWTYFLNLDDWMDQLEYQMIGYHAGGEIIAPCEPQLVWTSPNNIGLVVNEVMASNATTNWDETGAFEDWIELFNDSDNAIYLGDKYLTDDIDNPLRWKMPDVTIDPGGFILFWADKDLDEGILHTNFKLNSSGEAAAIFQIEQGTYRMVDMIEFGPQTTDISYGRETDADPDWISFEVPTPNGPNGQTFVEESPNETWMVFPNPTNGLLSFSSPSSGRIYDQIGQEVKQFGYTQWLDISDLASGVYTLKTSTHTLKIVRK
ncbi:MAG: T9SS type A sorting domain-containing protein, partial [Flavobacteriales bacterium]|nr:T9SS type A sorting domain-containing protein [Flavobacteriales bacterium]